MKSKSVLKILAVSIENCRYDALDELMWLIKEVNNHNTEKKELDTVSKCYFLQMTVAAARMSYAEGMKMKLAWKSCGVFWRTPSNDLFF